MAVQRLLDIEVFAEVFEDRLAQGVATTVRIAARRNVRIDTRRLRNSIRTEKLGFAEFATFAQTPYALAQEFGRPDLPRYGFTPYMRPAAVEAASQRSIRRATNQATEAAILAARRS